MSRFAVLVALLAFVVPALAQTASRNIYYQGRLLDDGQPVESPGLFSFVLEDETLSIIKVVTLEDVEIRPGGLFSVALDFGETAPDGDPIWDGNIRSILVAANGTLLGRQYLLPAPTAYAVPGLWSSGTTFVSLGADYGRVDVGDGDSTTNLRVRSGNLNVVEGAVLIDGGTSRLDEFGLELGSDVALSPTGLTVGPDVDLDLNGLTVGGSAVQITPAGIELDNVGLCIDTDGACTAPPGGLRVGMGGILGTDSTNQHVLIQPNREGFVGVGTDSPTERLDVNGAVRVRGADIVEGFNSSTGDVIESGTVVSIDPRPGFEGRLMPSAEPYDTKVAGVVSGAGGIPYGMNMGVSGELDGDTKVALAGRVYVRCTNENGPIRPGDLLTSAATPGCAMKATDRSRTHGAVIGKAMSALDEETGLVLVLVNLQ